MNTAARLARSFYTAENGALCTNDDTAKEMVRAAAIDFDMSWEWSYTAVRDCLQWLEDYDALTPDEISEKAHEAADSLTDVYTADLVRWLALDPIAHVSHCDEAAEEMYEDRAGSLENRLRAGQYHAYTLAMAAIANAWPEEEESDEESAE